MNRAAIAVVGAVIVGVIVLSAVFSAREEPVEQVQPSDSEVTILEGYSPAVPAAARPPKPEKQERVEPEKKPEKPEPAPVSEIEKPPPSNARTLQFQAAMKLVRDGKKFEARAVLTRLLLDVRNETARKPVKEALDKLNKELVFSPMRTPDSVEHIVRPGDNLWDIARTYKTSVGLIQRINRKSSDVVRKGERLKILKGAFSVLIHKSAFRLTVFLNGHYICEYPIGIGRYDKTPEGTFEIEKKVKNPSWTDPKSGVLIKYGDPRNIIGTHWIGFKETGQFFGYGIHGTKDPSTIGKAVSNGCIRLRNGQVAELFDMLSAGDKVTIRE